MASPLLPAAVSNAAAVVVVVPALPGAPYSYDIERMTGHALRDRDLLKRLCRQGPHGNPRCRPHPRGDRELTSHFKGYILSEQERREGDSNPRDP